MILSPPEELKSRKRRSPGHASVSTTVFMALGVDEHTFYILGCRFSPSFSPIGYIRARLPSQRSMRTILVAVTATLRAGRPKDCICSFSGLHEAKYHFIRSSK